MTNKLKVSTGGYISVDRQEALRQNWPLIKTMLRPATVTPTEPTQSPQSDIINKQSPSKKDK